VTSRGIFTQCSFLFDNTTPIRSLMHPHTSNNIAAMCSNYRSPFVTRTPHRYTSNLPLTMVGVALVWVGWYSFNGGSGLRANGQAISALFVTQIAACTSAFTWCVCSYFDDGYVQITHMASGALAGLAGITPGSGYVSHTAGVPYGIIVGLSSFYGGKVRLLTLPPERPLPWPPNACTSSVYRAHVPRHARMSVNTH
jgi:hypothetical protein